MHRLLGLSRAPFVPFCDDRLHWESRARAAVRERVERLLRAGRGVWLRGRPDSGRHALLERAAGTLAGEGRCVAWGLGWPPAERRGVLERLAEVTGAGGEGADPLELAGAVYGELVGGFCRGGTVVVALEGEPAGERDREELAILAGLRLLGEPLVALALLGGTSPPLGSLEEVLLPPPTPGDLRDFLVHRAVACGRPDLLPRERLDQIAAASSGFGQALALARREVARMAFRGAAAEAREPVLDPSALDEVDRLLGALGHENASP